jgi:hypothetical protein
MKEAENRPFMRRRVVRCRVGHFPRRAGHVRCPPPSPVWSHPLPSWSRQLPSRPYPPHGRLPPALDAMDKRRNWVLDAFMVRPNFLDHSANPAALSVSLSTTSATVLPPARWWCCPRRGRFCCRRSPGKGPCPR